MIYFVRTASGPVKIGWTRAAIEVRIRALQHANHEALRVMRTIDGHRSAELWLHRHYRPIRIHGEWYCWHPSMLTVQPGPLPLGAAAKRRRQSVLRRERILRAAAAGWPDAAIAAASGLSREWVAQITKHEARGPLRLGPLSSAEFLQI